MDRLEEMSDTNWRKMTRDDMAIAYADLIQSDYPAFPELNKQIITRWSISGLKYIKKKAWGVNL